MGSRWTELSFSDVMERKLEEILTRFYTTPTGLPTADEALSVVTGSELVDVPAATNWSAWTPAVNDKASVVERSAYTAYGNQRAISAGGPSKTREMTTRAERKGSYPYQSTKVGCPLM